MREMRGGERIEYGRVNSQAGEYVTGTGDINAIGNLVITQPDPSGCEERLRRGQIGPAKFVIPFRGLPHWAAMVH